MAVNHSNDFFSRTAGPWINFGLTSHHQWGHMEMGIWFKISSERPEKRGIDLAIPRIGSPAWFPLHYRRSYHEGYGAPLNIKWLKSFWLDHKQTISGWGKFGKWRRIWNTWILWARSLMFDRIIEDNVLITCMKFVWKLHGNFGCHDKYLWKIQMTFPRKRLSLF